MKWRWIIIIAGISLIWVFMGSAVYADGGPHGGYTATGGAGGGLPDQCAGCHRVHQGQSTGKLLKADSPYALCLTCHNGAGSRLDVLDGVKLGSLVSPDAGVVRAVDIGDVTASVAPTADLSTGAGNTTDFTIAVRNRGATVANVTLAITNDSNLIDFATSSLADITLNVPAAAGNVPGVAYTTLTTTSLGGATVTASNLTTLQITFSAQNDVVVAQTRVAAAADITAGGQYGLNTLNGGGFRYINGTQISSRHNADPADNSLNPWGFNANTGQNTNALASPLQCTSCHNPHGTSNYRLLKETINTQSVVVQAFFDPDGVGPLPAAFTKDEGARGLDAGAPTDKYTKEYYGSAGGGGAPITAGEGSMSSLCGACHTAYPSTGASEAYNVGGVTHYRHKTEMPYTDWTNPETGTAVTNNPETSPLAGFPGLRLASNTGEDNTIVSCLTCHRVHGSASTMDGYALMQQFGGLGDDDLTPSQTAAAGDGSPGASVSTLLYTDNRGMCQACHQWP